MKVKDRVNDVFVSHAMGDAKSGRKVADTLKAAGLAVFRPAVNYYNKRHSEEVRSALAESRAVVAVIADNARKSHALAFEIGAALAWQKPVFVVEVGSNPRIPNYLENAPRFTESNIPKLIIELERQSAPLLPDQIWSLANLYRDAAIPSDQLARRPVALEKLTRAFNKRTDSHFSPERVLQELIRLRKRGQLTSTSAKGRDKESQPRD